MNKEFDKLNIKQQVNFINAELRKDKKISVTKLCKKFELKKSTIISRFTKNGYKYNVDAREYTKDIVIQNNNKSISTNEIEVHKNNLTEVKELKTTLAEVKELLEIKEELKEVIQYYNKSKNIKNIIDVPKIELKIDTSKFKGELKGRLIKVYKNINNDWIKFCKKEYSQFKMQDLYSLALLEFMDKYSKK